MCKIHVFAHSTIALFLLPGHLAISSSYRSLTRCYSRHRRASAEFEPYSVALGLRGRCARSRMSSNASTSRQVATSTEKPPTNRSMSLTTTRRSVRPNPPTLNVYSCLTDHNQRAITRISTFLLPPVRIIKIYLRYYSKSLPSASLWYGDVDSVPPVMSMKSLDISIIFWRIILAKKSYVWLLLYGSPCKRICHWTLKYPRDETALTSTAFPLM